MKQDQKIIGDNLGTLVRILQELGFVELGSMAGVDLLIGGVRYRLTGNRTWTQFGLRRGYGDLYADGRDFE